MLYFFLKNLSAEQKHSEKIACLKLPSSIGPLHHERNIPIYFLPASFDGDVYLEEENAAANKDEEFIFLPYV